MQVEGNEEADANATIEQKLSYSAKNNNNQHVVPFGMLILLCTIYIMGVGLQNKYKYFFEASVVDAHPERNNLKQMRIMEKQQPTCHKLDIFIKESILKKGTDQLPWTKANKSINRNGYHDGKQLSNNRRKDNSKRINTAEPIIYLFALVFIYLLLKAASDINQHYKTQTKGDKRLRRCSLQSYAQAHKQDRRASKDSSRCRGPSLLTEPRSLSVDRYCSVHNEKDDTLRSQMLSNLRKQTSMGVPSHSQLLAGTPLEYPKSRYFSHHRRLSVPVSNNYQTVQLAHSSDPQLVRRSSIISLGTSMLNVDVNATGFAASGIQTTLDTKRRVRMINRH